jgi:hypothetical protein
MERGIRLLAAAVIALLAASCSKESGPVESMGAETLLTVEAGAPFQLKLGESVKLGSNGPSVFFASVGHDSRCPADVTCVWAGDAAVELRLGIDGVRRQVELHTSQEPRQAAIGDYLLVLDDLLPAPRSGTMPRSNDYVAVLRVATR